MPHVNPEILRWARETAGLSVEDAVRRLDLKEARGVAAPDRLAALEAGESIPSRPLLVKMAKLYRRPLLTFYMSAPPKKGDRGEDFRNLPDSHRSQDVLVDALVRDVRARQNMVRSILEDEEARPLPFVGSMKMKDGVGSVLAAIRREVRVDLADFRAQSSPEGGFGLLRNAVESTGVYVLLIGNLGTHHTAIDVDSFRGFAIADEFAPFIVINDQDAKAAWSFTLLHELAHIWLGTTGVSGAFVDAGIEQFCNDVASSYLLPAPELQLIGIDKEPSLNALAQRISDFADERLLSRSMVAYRLFRAGVIKEDAWRLLAGRFREEWRQSRDAQRERDRQRKGGPSYYVVRRHRLGAALLRFVGRNLSEGTLTPTKAGKVLGVGPRSVEPLLGGTRLLDQVA